jgi:hypothetical protein
LFGFVLFCFVLFCFVLFCFVLFCFVFIIFLWGGAFFLPLSSFLTHRPITITPSPHHTSHPSHPQELILRNPCARRECLNPQRQFSKYCSHRCGVLQARYNWRVCCLFCLFSSSFFFLFFPFILV